MPDYRVLAPIGCLGVGAAIGLEIQDLDFPPGMFSPLILRKLSFQASLSGGPLLVGRVLSGTWHPDRTIARARAERKTGASENRAFSDMDVPYLCRETLYLEMKSAW